MNISTMNKLCISIFNRNNTLIPYNKPVQIDTIHNHTFKMLQFYQDPHHIFGL